MSLVQSTIFNQSTNIEQFIVPFANNITDSVLRSRPPYVASLAYDVTSNRLYYADGTTWNLLDISSAAPITIGAPIVATDNNSLKITGVTLSAELAGGGFGGVLSNTTQTITGDKTFGNINAT